jgi:hypothetical protein
MCKRASSRRRFIIIDISGAKYMTAPPCAAASIAPIISETFAAGKTPLVIWCTAIRKAYRRYRVQPQHDFEETWPSKMVRSIARKMQQSEK